MSLIIFLKDIKEDKKMIFSRMSKWKLEVLTSPTPQTSPHSGSPQDGGGGGGAKGKIDNLIGLSIDFCCIVIVLFWKGFLLISLKINIKADSHQLGKLLC